MERIFTVGEISRQFGVPQWTIRGIVDLKDFPPVTRFGLKRVLTESHVQELERRLLAAGLISSGSANEGAHAGRFKL
jgi:hypothetical protein